MLEEQLAAANTITPTEDGGEIVGGERIVFSVGPHGEMDPPHNRLWDGGIKNRLPSQAGGPTNKSPCL